MRYLSDVLKQQYGEKVYKLSLSSGCTCPNRDGRVGFGGLQRTKYEFPSDKGQMLTGYLYSSGDNQRGIIVIAHGFPALHP